MSSTPSFYFTSLMYVMSPIYFSSSCGRVSAQYRIMGMIVVLQIQVLISILIFLLRHTVSFRYAVTLTTYVVCSLTSSSTSTEMSMIRYLNLIFCWRAFISTSNLHLIGVFDLVLVGDIFLNIVFAVLM